MRLDNWPKRLNEFIETNRFKPFVWGSHDCCAFAADGIKEITGIDIAKELRNTYSDKDGADAIINQYGGIPKMFESLMQKYDVKFCQSRRQFLGRGDIAILKLSDGVVTVGIFLGKYAAYVGPQHLEFVSSKNVSYGWGII